MSAMQGNTKVLGIFGDPVEHSLSPAMQNAAFAALRLPIVYVPFHVRRSELRKAIEGIRALGLLGVNITVPHKEAVLSLLDDISAEARALGAVNTVVRRGAHLVGYNTDSRGFRASLDAARVHIAKRSAIVIGAGGAAHAVAAALVSARCREIIVVNRTTARAQRLARRMRRPRVPVTAAPWTALADEDFTGRADLIVNCTPIGLGGESIEPFAYGATHRRCVFVDLVYRREPTPFLRGAHRLGRRTLDGAGMLLHQGALAFSLWTGRRAPLSVMSAALQAALGRRRGR